MDEISSSLASIRVPLRLSGPNPHNFNGKSRQRLGPSRKFTYKVFFLNLNIGFGVLQF